MHKPNARLVNWFFRTLCRVQSITMSARLNAAQLVSVIIGAAIVAFEIITSIGDSVFGMGAPIIFIGILAIIVPALNEILTIRRNNVSHIINTSKMYHDGVIDRLTLSPEYLESGYCKRPYEDCGTTEWHVDSPQVNAMLLEGSFDEGKALPLTEKKPAFNLPDEVRPLASGIIKRMLQGSKSRRFFNGKLTRLGSDLLVDSWDRTIVQKTRYFDGQCTHEIVYKRVSNTDSVEDNFLGEKLLLDDDDCMIELWASRCANFMGSSTIAITSDGALLVGTQGGQSMANANRLAPSGSGSVEYSDFTKLKASSDANTLQNLVVRAAERELREECALPDGVGLKSHVIGYTRLLERGGKPDFFCMTRIDITEAEVMENFEQRQRVSEAALGCKPLAVRVAPGQKPSAALYAFLEKFRSDRPDAHRISIQLQLCAEYLEAAEEHDASKDLGF